MPAAVSLNMANGLSGPVGTTPPLTISCGAGITEITTQHCFLVVPTLPSGSYDMLLGNVDMLAYEGIHDVGRGVLELFPGGRDGLSCIIPVEARSTRTG